VSAPRVGDHRIREDPKPDGTSYWWLEKWLPCSCPDCAQEFHWMWASGSQRREDVDPALKGLQK